jgi:hypothetical protein
MEWVLLEKFERVGTAQGSVRAEIVVDKKLPSAHQSQRERKLCAAEDALIKYTALPVRAVIEPPKPSRVTL